jgi:hypothetical protein
MCRFCPQFRQHLLDIHGWRTWPSRLNLRRHELLVKYGCLVMFGNSP